MKQAQNDMSKSILKNIINESVDSLRFYYLGSNYKTKVERRISVDQLLISLKENS